MPAFLPRIAQTMLGEPLKLPNAATWWCGGEDERAYVMANLDNLVISSAFRQPITGLPDGHSRAGSSLTTEERVHILSGMAHRPMDYTAQEIVSLSTTPALIEGRFEPRGFTLRAFLARDANGRWMALPGGFARISQYGDLRTSLMGMGDISTDVCIVDTAPSDKVVTSEPEHQEPRREQGLLPSQAADNLYWLGRYGERAHQVVRIVRTHIEQIAASGERQTAASAATRLANLLRTIGAVPLSSTKWQPARLAGTALGDREQSASVRGLAVRARQIALLLRDRLTRDSWRGIQRTMPAYIPGDLESMSGACDQLVERFAALARLTADGMSRGPAWDFLDMGMCLERGSIVLQAVQALTSGKPSHDDLAAMLELVGGLALYRSRYLAAPTIVPVIDQVLLDPTQPRGFAFQVVEIERHLAALPTIREDGMIEKPLRLVRQLNAKIEGLDAKDIDAEVIGELRAMLAALSDAIDNRYFLQEEALAAKDRASFLA